MRSFNSLAIDDFLRREFAAMPTRGTACLLDLGCGTRPYVGLYAERFGWSVAGDFEQRTADLDVRLDATALPFANHSFDLVLFSEVVEHVSEAEKALAEIARVLRPGALLLITWPFNYMIHEDPRDYVRFTEFGMARLLHKHGMEMEKVVYRGGLLTLLVAISEFLIVSALEAASRFPVLGRVIRPLRNTIARVFFELPYSLYFRLRHRLGITSRFRVGNGLVGWHGSLRRWTLGYCACVRKASRQ